MPIHRSSVLAALALCARAAAPATAVKGRSARTRLSYVQCPHDPPFSGAQKTSHQTLSGGDGTSITQQSTLTIKYATGQ